MICVCYITNEGFQHNTHAICSSNIIIFVGTFFQCELYLFFWSLDLPELWHSVLSTDRITNVKQQWAMLVSGCVTI